jgi:uncharacterized protein (TIGR00645 family)
MFKPRAQKNVLEHLLETLLFNARWLMAPFYIGLMIALAALLWVFFMDLIHSLAPLLSSTDPKPETAILMALSLIDLSLGGNLLLIVTFSGYENFVSKIDTAGHEDRPEWMGTVNFSGLKLKLISSIVAISGIALLKAFMQLGEGAIDERKLYWMIILHLTFIASGVALAFMDWIVSRSGGKH